MIARWRDALVEWIKWRLITPAVNAVILAMQQDHARTREKMMSYIDAAMKQQTSRLLGEIGTVRVEVELLRAALPIAEQMNDFAAKVESVDERLSHLTAHLCGTTTAEKIRTSRGPREFTHEVRQWHE